MDILLPIFPFTLSLSYIALRQRAAMALAEFEFLAQQGILSPVRQELVFGVVEWTEEQDRLVENQLARLQTETYRPLYAHVSRVSETAGQIAALAGFTPAEVHIIKQCAKMHDIGKIEDDQVWAIVSKQENLSDEEFEMMKQHTVLGAKRLSLEGAHPLLVATALEHHIYFSAQTESQRARSYPSSIPGSLTSIPSRVVQVADAYDSMRHRDHRSGYTTGRMDVFQATAELQWGIGMQFHPMLRPAIETFCIAQMPSMPQSARRGR